MERFCRYCGNKVLESTVICPSCGSELRNYNTLRTKDRITTALLAFFLGGLGLHKFYLNKPIQGLLYILFCWTFIPLIISFIEGIIYLFMSDKRFQEKYGQ